MSVRTLLASLLAALLTSTLLAPSAQAIPLTFNFSGTVTEVDGSLVGIPILVGDPLSGSYTYESTTVDANGTPSNGDYGLGLLAFSYTVGSYSGSLGTSNGLQVFDSAIIDAFTLETDPAASGGFDFDVVYVFAYKNFPTSDGLPDDSLPLAALDPADFDFVELLMAIGGTSLVRSNITSITLVPEPGTLAFVGMGLLVLGASIRRV